MVCGISGVTALFEVEEDDVASKVVVSSLIVGVTKGIFFVSSFRDNNDDDANDDNDDNEEEDKKKGNVKQTEIKMIPRTPKMTKPDFLDFPFLTNSLLRGKFAWR